MDTWIRLIVWMLIGLDIYLIYGAKHSHLGDGTLTRPGMSLARKVGLVLCIMLTIAGFLHQYTVGFKADRALLYVSIIFAIAHFILYGARLYVNRRVGEVEKV